MEHLEILATEKNPTQACARKESDSVMIHLTIIRTINHSTAVLS